MKSVLFRAALWLALFFAAAPALADQGSYCLPVTGTVSGLTIVEDINAGFQAVVTANSGGSAPTNPCGGAPQLGQQWLDTSTTPNVLRIYDGANWLPEGAVDAVSHLWTPPVGGGIGSLASASTTDLGSVAPAYDVITGSTGITSLGTTATAGAVRFLRFAGALTLTYNATSLILPTAANISTAANDRATAVALGSGNWIVLSYQRADGTPLALGAGQVATANIAAGAVTSAKIGTNAAANSNLAQMGAKTIKGNATASTANAADLSAAQLRAFPQAALRGQLWGLTLSNDGGTPASVIDLAAGEAADDSATPTLMVLGSAYTKSLASGWAVGSGNGCWDSGSIASPSSVHFFLVERPDTGVVDVLCSASASSPTLPTNYTLKRRLGSDLYQSSALLAFVQDGDVFAWNTSSPPDDLSSGGNRAKAALTITVPSGIRVRARFIAHTEANNTGRLPQLIFFDGLNTSIEVAVGHTAPPVSEMRTVVEQFTNTSAQIQLQVSGNPDNYDVTTVSWTDPRGRT